MELHILSGGAAAGLVEPLQAEFEAAHACRLLGTFSAVGAMKEKLLAGAPCDLVILTQALVEGLMASGHVRADSLRYLGVVKTGLAVKTGTPHPAIQTRADLQAAFRAAEGIYFPDPQLATAGIHFLKVLTALGLQEELADRFRTYPNGATAMREMAKASGHVMGGTQVTEINYTQGVDLIGLFPQEFELATVYALGVATNAKQAGLAQQLADLLCSDRTRALRMALGFELAH
ncbi:molybdate ABC transporter substrate-binding protein [Limnohabitans sp.]|uniref:molybdate ABC transporter substrate-binding protein n=1 Tax=Limnohabitans sp. TaxID=1907725 RepID=UPI0038BBC6A6